MPKAISCVEEAVFEVEGGVMKLLDACELIVDCPHSTAKDEGSGYPLIRTPNIGKGRLKLEGVHRVSYETYCARNERAVPKTDDLILAREAPVGNVAIIKNGQQVCLGQRTVLIRPNKNIVEPDFLVYYLLAPEMQHMLLSAANGATVSHLNMADIRKLEISLPDLEVQKKIGRLLSTIEDKIETNNEINDNLEQQLLSYYHELFVANAKENWEEGTIADLGKVVGGSTPSKKKTEYYTDHGIAWITPKDLSNDHSKFITHGEIDITELGLSNSSAVLMPAGTVLFSSRAPIGYIAIADGEVTTNQGFKSIIPFENIGTAYVYCFLKENLSVIDNMASGSTFKEISGGTMKTVPALIPDEDTLSIFRDYAAAVFNQQRNNESENRALTSIRDSLLPKLMSGELDVSNLDI